MTLTTAKKPETCPYFRARQIALMPYIEEVHIKRISTTKITQTKKSVTMNANGITENAEKIFSAKSIAKKTEYVPA